MELKEEEIKMKRENENECEKLERIKKEYEEFTIISENMIREKRKKEIKEIITNNIKQNNDKIEEKIDVNDKKQIEQITNMKVN